MREGWPWVAAAMIVAGLPLQSVALVMLGFAFGIACWGAQLWARYSLRRVVYERQVPEDHAFARERVGVTLRIANRKPLPLPWIEVHETFAESMLATDAVDRDDFRQLAQVGVAGLAWRTSVGSHERISRHIDLECPDRGVYEIGPSTLRSGDGFGLFSDERTEARRTRIVVYPRTYDIGDLGLPSRRPYGEDKGTVRVFEDPARVAGIRDYRPGDSLRRIDWNATARLGKLQSRVYEPSSSQHLLIALNTQTLIPSWAGYVHDLLEHSVTVAASIARDAYERRYSVGLLANSTFPELNQVWQHQSPDTLSGLARARDLRERAAQARSARTTEQGRQRAARGSIRIPPGRRPEQFIRLLEALAVVTPFVMEPLSAMLDREEHRLGVGTTIAVVTGTMPADLETTLRRLHRRGHNLTVLSTSGELWLEQLEGIAVRDVSAHAIGADVREWRRTPDLDDASAAVTGARVEEWASSPWERPR